MSLEDGMFEGALMGRLRQGNRALAEANSEIHRANQIIPALEARIAELELALKVRDAEADGLSAQVNAMRQQHPDSPLLAASGHRFPDGRAKSKLRLIWENTFDASLRKMGISNPERYRQK